MYCWGSSFALLKQQYLEAKKKIEKEKKEKKRFKERLNEHSEGSLFEGFDYSGKNLEF